MFPFASMLMAGGALPYTLQAFVLPVAGGTLEVPVDCKGHTPKLIIFDTLGIEGLPPQISTTQFAISRGAADASGNQFCIMVHKTSGAGSEINSAHSDRCFQINTEAGLDDHGSFVSAGANRFTLNITNTSGKSACVIARVFYGSDLSAKVGTFASTTSISTITTGWRPDAMIFASLWNTPFDGSTNQLFPLFGYASYDGTTLSQCSSGHRYYAAGDGGMGVVASDCVAVLPASSASPAFYKVALTAANSTGFSHSTTVPSGSVYTGYIALNFNGNGNARAGLIDSPTAPGTRTLAISGASFTPNTMFLTATNMATVNTRYTAGEGTGFALLHLSPDTQFVLNNRISDNGAIRGRRMLEQAIYLSDHLGTLKSEGTFSSWTTGGLIASMTTVDATVRKWPALAMQFTPS